MIYAITPFTTIDYPGKLSCIVWFGGCNLRCVYCYNKDIVLNNGKYDLKYLENFLSSRQGKLQGVVFSGGECTINSLFLDASKIVKNLGFSLKIDTNGTNSKNLQKIIDENLADFIALDFKAMPKKQILITKKNYFDEFLKCFEILKNSKIEFEIRTTIHNDFLNEEDVMEMYDFLKSNGYKNHYYIQKFLNTGENLANLKNPKTEFDRSKIPNNLDIIFRGFDVEFKGF